MAWNTVLYERRGRVGIITLNRPERLNAVDDEMEAELPRVWWAFDEDNECAVAVVTGAGRGFCSGADMKSAAAAREANGRGAQRTRDGLPPLTARQNGFWKPVIVAVNGVCAGAGLYF